jgi:hypothetical protein
MRIANPTEGAFDDPTTGGGFNDEDCQRRTAAKLFLHEYF